MQATRDGSERGPTLRELVREGGNPDLLRFFARVLARYVEAQGGAMPAGWISKAGLGFEDMVPGLADVSGFLSIAGLRRIRHEGESLIAFPSAEAAALDAAAQAAVPRLRQQRQEAEREAAAPSVPLERQMPQAKPGRPRGRPRKTARKAAQSSTPPRTSLSTRASAAPAKLAVARHIAALRIRAESAGEDAAGAFEAILRGAADERAVKEACGMGLRQARKAVAALEAAGAATRIGGILAPCPRPASPPRGMGSGLVAWELRQVVPEPADGREAGGQVPPAESRVRNAALPEPRLEGTATPGDASAHAGPARMQPEHEAAAGASAEAGTALPAAEDAGEDAVVAAVLAAIDTAAEGSRPLLRAGERTRLRRLARKARRMHGRRGRG